MASRKEGVVIEDLDPEKYFGRPVATEATGQQVLRGKSKWNEANVKTVTLKDEYIKIAPLGISKKTGKPQKGGTYSLKISVAGIRMLPYKEGRKAKGTERVIEKDKDPRKGYYYLNAIPYKELGEELNELIKSNSNAIKANHYSLDLARDLADKWSKRTYQDDARDAVNPNWFIVRLVGDPEMIISVLDQHGISFKNLVSLGSRERMEDLVERWSYRLSESFVTTGKADARDVAVSTKEYPWDILGPRYLIEKTKAKQNSDSLPFTAVTCNEFHLMATHTKTRIDKTTGKKVKSIEYVDSDGEFLPVTKGVKKLIAAPRGTQNDHFRRLVAEAKRTNYRYVNRAQEEVNIQEKVDISEYPKMHRRPLKAVPVGGMSKDRVYLRKFFLYYNQEDAENEVNEVDGSNGTLVDDDVVTVSVWTRKRKAAAGHENKRGIKGTVEAFVDAMYISRDDRSAILRDVQSHWPQVVSKIKANETTSVSEVPLGVIDSLVTRRSGAAANATSPSVRRPAIPVSSSGSTASGSESEGGR